MRLMWKSLESIVILFGFMNGLDASDILFNSGDGRGRIFGFLMVIAVTFVAGYLLYTIWSREIQDLLR